MLKQYEYIMHLPNPPPQINGIIDMYGNEHDTFLILFSDVLETSFDSTCSDATCPNKSVRYTSKSVEIPLMNKNTNHPNKRQYFFDCVKQWHENNTVSNNQRLTNHGTHCPGIRSRTARKFVRNMTFFLPINLDLFSKNKSLVTIDDLPK